MATKEADTEKKKDHKVSKDKEKDGGMGDDEFKLPRESRKAKDEAKSKMRGQSRSKSSGIPLSPIRFQPLTQSKSNEPGEQDQPWECELCSKLFDDDNDKILECMKCSQHFCIKCLGKTPEQYEMMQDPDIMWFCVPCRKVIERSIEVEKQIEEKCNETKSMYEDRLTEIKAKLDTKVNETGVKRIAKEVFQEEIKLNPELKQITKTTVGEILQEIQVEAPAVLATQNDKSDEENITRSVVNEINEQKARERNFVMYGMSEPAFASKEDRATEENQRMIKIAKICQVYLKQENITKIHRLGKYDPKENRPILVCLDDLDCKINLFRNFNKKRN